MATGAVHFTHAAAELVSAMVAVMGAVSTAVEVPMALPMEVVVAGQVVIVVAMPAIVARMPVVMAGVVPIVVAATVMPMPRATGGEMVAVVRAAAAQVELDREAAVRRGIDPRPAGLGLLGRDTHEPQRGDDGESPEIW